MAGQRDDDCSPLPRPGSIDSPAGLEFVPVLPSSLILPSQTPADDIHVRIRSSRVERPTTSCGECRRRKQKCNQGRPCGNCAKRYPLPACEYKQSKHPKHPTGGQSDPVFQIILPRQNDPPSGQSSSLLPFPLMHTLPTPLLSPQTSAFSASYALVAGQPLSLDEPWAQPFEAVDTAPAILFGEDYSDISPDDNNALDSSLGSWPGFDMTPADTPHVLVGSIPAAGHPDGQYLSTEPYMDAASPSDLLLGSNRDDGCASTNGSDVHEQVLGDAFSLLEAHGQPLDLQLGCPDTLSGADTMSSWLRIVTWTAPPPASSSCCPARPSLADAQSLGQVQTYMALISRFTLCLDSHSNRADPYADASMFAPSCLHNPLLRQVALYTSACFLSEAKHVDRMAAGAHVSRTVTMLTAQLHPGTPMSASPSDATMLAAVQMVMNQWYRGNITSIHAHLGGLYEMLRMRGGSKQLGINGLTSKLAIATIYLSGIHRSGTAIAMSLDTSQPLPARAGFGFQSVGPQAAFRVGHNTPLVAQLVSFDQCAEALGMHPAVASILDDVRFLVEAVLSLPRDPSTKDLQKIQTTAEWIRNRLRRLPDDAPEPPDADILASAESLSLSAGGHGHGHGHVERGASPQTRLRQPASATVSGGDALYQAVRPVALLYCDAILARRPFSAVVQPDDFRKLWTAAWRVSLAATWRGVLGVFMWITLAVVASAPGDSPQEVFVRSMLSVCTAQMSLESWDVAVRALQAALRLDAWLHGDY